MGIVLSCRLFEFSPFEAPFRDRGDAWLGAQLARIGRTDGSERRFSFIVIADIQNAYDELDDAVRRINLEDSARFVIVAGDLTQYGLLNEFLWVKASLDRLGIPYLPVLGNHDALANGSEIFRKMFGPLDYSFRYRGTKFILFNDNSWEFGYTVPDTAWLAAQLRDSRGTRLVPIAHIPPWGDQINPESGHSLIDLFNRFGTELCIFGHQQNYHFEIRDGNRMPYLIVDDIGDRSFAKVTLDDSSFWVERIFF